MLYLYKGKIYVKPMENKIVEVKISKKDNNYNVTATNNIIEINDKERLELQIIGLKQAFERQKAFNNEKSNRLKID